MKKNGTIMITAMAYTAQILRMIAMVMHQFFLLMYKSRYTSTNIPPKSATFALPVGAVSSSDFSPAHSDPA
eukprot:2052456-Ditylum_brightwellii.AAC.1